MVLTIRLLRTVSSAFQASRTSPNLNKSRFSRKQSMWSLCDEQYLTTRLILVSLGSNCSPDNSMLVLLRRGCSQSKAFHTNSYVLTPWKMQGTHTTSGPRRRRWRKSSAWSPGSSRPRNRRLSSLLSPTPWRTGTGFAWAVSANHRLLEFILIDERRGALRSKVWLAQIPTIPATWTAPLWPQILRYLHRSSSRATASAWSRRQRQSPFGVATTKSAWELDWVSALPSHKVWMAAERPRWPAARGRNSTGTTRSYHFQGSRAGTTTRPRRPRAAGICRKKGAMVQSVTGLDWTGASCNGPTASNTTQGKSRLWGLLYRPSTALTPAEYFRRPRQGHGI